MYLLDADKYRVNVPTISSLTKDKSHKDIIDLLGILAITTNVPIIIVATYIGEIQGFFPELQEFIELHKKFYGVDEVINVRKKEIE